MTAPVADPGLHALLTQVERDRGLSLRSYKDKCLRRRLAVRMRARGVHAFTEYAALLGRSPEEYEQLVTIDATDLDPGALDELRRTVILLQAARLLTSSERIVLEDIGTEPVHG